MTTAYPTSLDVFTNPQPTDAMNVVLHSDQHANANDAIEAIEAKIGVTGSAVAGTVEYRLSASEGGSVYPTQNAYTLTSADSGKRIINRTGLPLYVLISKGLSAQFSCQVVQSGRGRVYIAWSGPVVNGVSSGRIATCRRGQKIDVRSEGSDIFAIDVPSKETVVANDPGYILIDTSGATYSWTGTLITITHSSHGFQPAMNGKDVFIMTTTGGLVAGRYTNWTYVDANTYTLTTPSAALGTLTGNLGGASTIPTMLVNEANVILFGGQGSGASTATYSQAGNLITVSMTAHGLTATYNGCNAHTTIATGGLPTGVYRNFLYVDANTFSLIAPDSATRTGNLGTNTTETLLIHSIIPGDALGENGELTVSSIISNLATGTKSYRQRIGRATPVNGTAMRLFQNTTNLRGSPVGKLFAVNGNYQAYAPGSSGTENSLDGTTVAAQVVALDFAIDQTLKITGTVSAATDWMCIHSVVAEVTRGQISPPCGAGAYIGMNMSGLEFGNVTTGVYPTDYRECPLADYQYWAAKGVKNFRLPVLWERLTANTLSGAINTTYSNLIIDQLDKAASVGGKLLIDLHNYAKYAGVAIGSGPTQADLVDVWTKLVPLIQNHSALLGYEVMNEPVSSIGIATWMTIQQAVIAAIRAIDTVTPIYVTGIATSADQALSTNNTLRATDPYNNLVFCGHVYCDEDSSGTHSVYATSAAAFNTTYIGQPGVVQGFSFAGAASVNKFAQWLRQMRQSGAITETGAPWGNDDRWRSENMVYMLLSALSRGLPVFLWGGGSVWSPGYIMRIHPQAATPDVDMPQIAYLQPLFDAFNSYQ